jgi:uncharacterized membrane protein
MLQTGTNSIIVLIFILIPCIAYYVETKQLNALKLYTSLFFYDGSYMFRQNNVILRERLFSFLSHFSVNTVGVKSEYNKIVQ